jgi:aminopeptidase N
MSLFCTQAAKQNLERYSDFIFKITQKCMLLFQDKFGVKYPFKKYDQIFIREFGALAMENAGLVTFDEASLLPRETPTQYDYYYLGLVVSHELSHHWFGNYVTMVWWDDLWLNESFAEWMSCYSLEQLKDDFQFESYFYFRDGKVRGYEEDERNNATHPIRGTVANTDEAFSIFDGITYEKGASVLKQLTFLVGDDNFFLALTKYFKRFAWSNATIENFLAYVGEYLPPEAGKLEDWKQMWLEEASLNVFSVDWDQDNSKITLKQSSFNDSNVLRVHKLKIALFNPDGTYTTIPKDVFLQPVPSTEIAYEGGPYSAVLVNHQDETFAENIIDAVSLAYFRGNIDKIEDLFTRLMIWYNFRSMVNLSLIPIIDYVGFVKEKLFLEPSTFILEKILESLLFFLDKFIDQDLGNMLRSSVCQLIYQELQTTADELTERIQILQDYYVEYAHSEA